MRGLFPAVVALTLLPGCSRISILDALSPWVGITEARDIPYAPGERHSLDIYAPKAAAQAGAAAVAAVDGGGSGTGAPAEQGRPVVVFFHGGGWQEGDKANFRFVGATLAAWGYVTVVPEYRLYPAVRFPAFIQDAAAAVAWIRENIARHGGDPHRIFLMGHSAGAYIAAMLTLDRQWLGAEGLDADRDIAGLVGLAGPYDFLPLHDRRLEEIFAPAGDLTRSQPISFVRGGAPPMLLASGVDNSVVQPRNTEHLAAAIRRDGGQVEDKFYRGVGHSLILGCFVWPLRWIAPVLHDVTTFMDRHTGGASAAGGGSAVPARAGVAAANAAPR